MMQIFFKFYFMNGRLDFISIIDFSVFPIMVMSCWPALVRKCHAPPCCLLFLRSNCSTHLSNRRQQFAGPFQKFLWSPNWLPRGLPDSGTYILSLTDSEIFQNWLLSGWPDSKRCLNAATLSRALTVCMGNPKGGWWCSLGDWVWA